MVSCLIFISLSHFELIFVCGISKYSNSTDLHVGVQLSQHYLLKRFLFSTVYSYLPCQRIIDCRCVGICHYLKGHKLAILLEHNYQHILMYENS